MGHNRSLIYASTLFISLGFASLLQAANYSGFSRPQKHVATVLSFKGQVTLYRNFSRSFQYAKKNLPLSDEIIIRTRENSELKIKLKSGGELVIYPQSKVHLRQGRNGLALVANLHHGKLYFSKLTPDIPAFAIVVPSKKDGILGQSFFISYNKGKRRIFSLKQQKVFKVKNLNATNKENRMTLKKLDQILKEKKEKTPPLQQEIASREITPPTPSSPPSSNSREQEFENIFEEDLSTKTPPPKKELTKTKSELEIENIFGISEDEGGKNEKFVEVKLENNYVQEKKSKRKRIKRTSPKELYQEESQDSSIDLAFLLKSSIYTSKLSENKDIDKQRIHIDGRLKLAKRFKLDKSSSITTNGHLELSNREEIYREFGDSLSFRSEKRSRITLNEAYYLENFKNSDLTIGKKTLKLGKGIIYSPSDRLTPTDSIIPDDPLSLGNFLISYDYYYNQHTFSFVLIPWPLFGKVPSAKSRWSTDLIGSTAVLRTQYPRGLKALQTLFKYETVLSSWDIFVSFFNGPNPDPSIRNDINIESKDNAQFNLTAEHIHVTNLSGGFSTTFGSIEAHAEFLLQNAQDGKDDSYLSSMYGFRYTMDEWPNAIGLNQIDWILEYANETIKEPISYPFYVASSINSRVYQNSLIGTLIFKVSDRLALNYDYHFDQENNGQAQFLGATYQTLNWGTLNLKLEFFSGEEKSLFGKWDKNDNFMTQWQYTF